MSISSVNTYDSSSTTTTTSSSSSSLDLTSSDFITLMVQQLQNQNPLDPTDTDTYMQQLVSFASYDTESSINDQLSTIVDSLDSTVSDNGLGYIGYTVNATGSTTSLADGEATWTYTLDSDAADTTITIYDEDGNEVWSGDGETDAGTYTFSWDGVTSDGTQLEDGGQYTIEVTATDEDGDDVSGSTTIIGKVTGLDVEDDDSMLMIGDASVAVENVISILSED